MGATRGYHALDSDPRRLVVLSELLSSTDPATLATAINNLSNHNQYTDAEKLRVQELVKFKGEHATGAALEAAYPAASQESDAWALVEDTDTVWVLDADTGAWKDTKSGDAPASVDVALSKASSNAVSNSAISTQMEQRHLDQVVVLPGDDTLVSFTVSHTFDTYVDSFVRFVGTKEVVVCKSVPASATTVSVGPFANAPAANEFEVVIIGKVNHS